MASFGENLRRERELRNVSLRDVADATKISIRFLEAIEQDRVEVLPGGIFRRAFVVQFAKYLGLDAERLAVEFEHVHGPSRAPEPPPRAPRRAPPWRGLLLASGAVALGLTWWTLSERAPSPGPAPVALPPPTTGAPPASLLPSPVVARSPEAVPEALVLTLTAGQPCWVAVEVDGRATLDRVLTEGETHTFEADGEFVLSVGNAGGLSFSVNDRPGLPLGRSGEVRKNIVINRGSLALLVEDVRSRDSQGG